MRAPRPITAAVAAAAIGGAALIAAPTAAVAAPLPSIVINEVESNQDEFDWVELMNTGTEPVDVSGWIVKDDNDARALAIAAGSVIEPGGFLAVNTDDDAVPGGFGLGANDEIRLFLPGGTDLVAEYSWTGHAATTYGRCPDGTGEFIVTLGGTKGAPNACEPNAAEVLVINEVVSNQGVPGDWVELKNLSTAAVDAGGLVLTDSNPANTYVIPDGTMVAGGGYLVLDELRSGAGHFDFGLGGADSAVLLDVDGSTVIDRIDWTSHPLPSFGRCADGVGAFAITATATKGAANDCVPSASAGAIVINEVESNGDVTDWVEIMNVGETAVDISGYRFRDNDATRPHWSVPAGTVVEAGAFYVIDGLYGANGGFDFGLGNADEVHLFEPDGVTEVASWSWTEHAVVTYGRCPDGTGEFIQTIASSKGAPNVCGIPVRINEVESSGGTPGDWIELKNLAATATDVSGLTVTDSNPANTFTIPTGTSIAAGGYLVLDEVVDGVGDFDFGLGGADSVRLLDGAEVVDEVSWTAHAGVTLGRCPDGTGPFAVTAAATKGAENHCVGDVVAQPWPGGADVRTIDEAGDYGKDLSGLDIEPTASGATLWAVENGDGILHRLTATGPAGPWVPAAGWAGGVALAYPDGSGTVDAEGVTVTGAGAAGGVYVASERSGAASGVSRPSVLRYDVTTAASPLSATTEWNLAADFPGLGANQGLEGVTWIADAELVESGFVDATTSAAYDPADYPGHGGGLFFIGVEGTAAVYAYALMTDGGFQRVATISTPFALVADVQWDDERGTLWVVCDEACNGRTAEYAVDATGAFAPIAVYERPAGMANIANEGFAIAPQAWCVDGVKPTYYSDDNDTDGHALREGTIECTELPDTEEPGTGPVPIPDSALTPETRGGVTSPESAEAGAQVVVTVGVAHAGESVLAWVHSTPILLGEFTVAPNGTIVVTLPAGLAAGEHKIVVTTLDGQLIGWAPLKVAAAGSLQATGAEQGWVGGTVLAALLALTLGGVVIARRRTIAARD